MRKAGNEAKAKNHNTRNIAEIDPNGTQMATAMG